MIQCGFERGASMLGVTPVQNIFISEYLPKAPEGYVKVYLYGLMQCCGREFTDDISAALEMDEAAIAEAFLYWQDRGLVTVSEGEPFSVEYRMATGAAQPVGRRKYGGLVAALRDAAESRIFAPAEYQKIYDWIEVFGMEPGAAVMLVRHCMEQKGKKVSIRYMDKLARAWADDGIFTAGDAEERIRMETEIQGGAKEILNRWRMKRLPTEDELELYRKWTEEMHLSKEDIFAACPAVTGADKPTFGYLDGILKGMTAEGSVQESIRAEELSEELARQIFIRAGMKGAPGRREKDAIRQWTSGWHMSPEAALLAAEYSANVTRPFDRVKKYMEVWHERGVTTLAEAKKQPREPEKKPDGRTSHFMNYDRRSYTEEELAGIGIKLLDEEDDI